VWVDALDLGREPGTSGKLLDLFRSPFLEDLCGLDPAFDRWLERERERLAGVARTIGEAMLADAHEPDDQFAAAERLLRVDPAHEGAWGAIIHCYAERGDRAAALAAFERCRASLAETSSIAPGRAILDLVARVRGGAAGASNLGMQPAPQAPPPRHRAVSAGIRLGVMPLRSLDPAGDAGLSLGLTEEVATGLSRVRGLSCIPLTSAAFHADGFSAPDKRPREPRPWEPRPWEPPPWEPPPWEPPPWEPRPWERLNLDFLLEGTVQRYAGHVRIMTRLIDIWAAGEVIWAQRFDIAESDVFATQDEIASRIVAQIDPRILLRQGERAATLHPDGATPHELLLQSIPAVYRLERRGFAAAGSHLELAIQEDPNHAAAHAWYAYWHLFLVGQGWAEDPEASSHRAAELAGRAVTLDPGDARSLALAGHVRGFLGKQAEEACTLHARAIALNPNLALAWCFSGLAQCYRGNHAEALRLIRQAIRLSPYDPHLFFFNMAMTMPHLLRGEYDEAVEIGRQAIGLNPGFTSTYKGHLSALGHLGRGREAERTLATLLSLEPHFSVTQAVARSPMQRSEDVERYAEGLRRAGLPE
jgi:TolB-like protein/Tfp pilus assembly protein PilF